MNIVQSSIKSQQFIPPYLPENERPAFFSLPQFVNWKPIEKDGKINKVPWDYVKGEKLSHGDPKAWMSYDDAVKSGHPHGFVFDVNCPYGAIDLDGCYSAAMLIYTRREAADIVADLKACGDVAIETSVSGTGVHIVGRVDLDKCRQHANKADGWREQYAGSHRFVAFGPSGWQGSGNAWITDVIAKHWPERRRVQNDGTLSTVPVPEWDGFADDDELIAAFKSSNSFASAFGEKVSNVQLWGADETALAKDFPPNNPADPFDRSSADMSLACRLMWWTGGHGERVVRLMRRSMLARPKWDDPRGDRGNYLTMTVGQAAAQTAGKPVMNRAQFVKERREATRQEFRDVGDGIESADVYTREMTLEDMTENLVFIGDGNGYVVERDTRRYRKMASAATEYADSFTPVETGKEDDAGNPIIKMKPTFGLWRTSRKLRADKLTWVPGEAEFCRPPEMNCMGYNVWTPPKPPCAVPENYMDYVRHFQEHLEYLIPVEAERNLFLLWLGHLFQKPEQLPHVYFVMVAEKHGIGRNLLAGMLTYALRGYVAAGVNLSDILDGKFNGRISQKLLTVVDEIKASQGAEKYRHENKLRSYITEDHRSIDVKFGLQSVEKNCMRWLMFSNHVDAIPLGNEDRRAVVIRNTDEFRPEAYYQEKYRILRDQKFAASLWHHLTHDVDISAFNPGMRAPMNDAKRDLIDALKSEASRVIDDLIEEWPQPVIARSAIMNRLTQSGENVSNAALTHLLSDARLRAVKKRYMVGSRKETVYTLPPREGRQAVTPEQALAMDNGLIGRMAGDNTSVNRPHLMALPGLPMTTR